MPTKSNSSSKSNSDHRIQPQDAGTGRFVTDNYAKSHPKTTFYDHPQKAAPKKAK